MTSVLTLPMPPSINDANRNRKDGRGRFTKKHVVDWRMAARVHLRQQNPAPICGPVLIVVNFERYSQLADVDNRIKLLLDFLAAEGVIDNDRNVFGIAAAWSPDATRSAHVAIMPVHDLAIDYRTAGEGPLGAWIIRAPQLPEREIN